MENLFNINPTVELVEVTSNNKENPKISEWLRTLSELDRDDSYSNPRISSMDDHRTAKSDDMTFFLYKNTATTHRVVDVCTSGSNVLRARITNQPKLFQERKLVDHGGYDVVHVS